MIEQSCEIALWLAVVWPLLLALPAVHSRLPQPRQLAIIPALILTLLPCDISLNVPWLFTVTDLAIDGDSRWLMFMAVIIWFMAGRLSKPTQDDNDLIATTFFLLSMTGSLGAILADNLVTFFGFSTLMGYSFYGLLVQGDNENLHRTGRMYLSCIVLADLILFEAMLLATSSTDNLTYDAVQVAIPEMINSPFYIFLVCLAFAFRSGAWPFCFWLTAAYRYSAPERTVLLSAVPVATALLGTLRWLAPGVQSATTLGTSLQLLGAAAIGYAALRLYMHRSGKRLPAWVSIFVTGIYFAALGTGLAYPYLWHQYLYVGYPLIAVSSLCIAALSYIVRQLPDAHIMNPVTQRMLTLSVYLLARNDSAIRWSSKWFVLQSHMKTFWLQLSKLYFSIQARLNIQSIETGWNARITVLVLLGLTMFWLAG